MKRRQATVWICACDHPDVEYDQCTPAKPFESLRRAKTAEHERQHLVFIERHKKLMAQVAGIQSIVTAELRIGTWDDWKGILEATKEFSKFVHEHQGIHRRSFFISSAGDNLEKAVKKLIWYQTKEGELVGGDRWHAKVSCTLDAMFDDIKLRGERKRCPKRSFMTRMVTAKKLINKITREARLIEQKFPNAEGLKEVGDTLRVCNHQMTSELHQSHGEAP